MLLGAVVSFLFKVKEGANSESMMNKYFQTGNKAETLSVSLIQRFLRLVPIVWALPQGRDPRAGLCAQWEEGRKEYCIWKCGIRTEVSLD